MGLNYYPRGRRQELDASRLGPFVEASLGRISLDYGHLDYDLEAGYFNDILDGIQERLENLNQERLGRD